MSHFTHNITIDDVDYVANISTLDFKMYSFIISTAGYEYKTEIQDNNANISRLKSALKN